MAPRDQHPLFVSGLLAIVTCGAFGLLFAGIDIAAVKQLLEVLFPPLIALIATGVGRGRSQ